MDQATEESATREVGFAEMWLALKIGDVPTQNIMAEKLNMLFALAGQTERVNYMKRDADKDIEQLVSIDRSRAQIPVHRFMGEIVALLYYSKACRDLGCVPGDVAGAAVEALMIQRRKA